MAHPFQEGGSAIGLSATDALGPLPVMGVITRLRRFCS